jgi:hypothetical protein
MLQAPLLEGRVIGIGLGLLQQVSDAPADGIAIAGTDKAIAFVVGPWQHIGNGSAEARFFCDIKYHGTECCINKQVL